MILEVDARGLWGLLMLCNWSNSIRLQYLRSIKYMDNYQTMLKSLVVVTIRFCDIGVESFSKIIIKIREMKGDFFK